MTDANNVDPVTPATDAPAEQTPVAAPATAPSTPAAPAETPVEPPAEDTPLSRAHERQKAENRALKAENAEFRLRDKKADILQAAMRTLGTDFKIESESLDQLKALVADLGDVATLETNIQRLVALAKKPAVAATPPHSPFAKPAASITPPSKPMEKRNPFEPTPESMPPFRQRRY